MDRDQRLCQGVQNTALAGIAEQLDYAASGCNNNSLWEKWGALDWNKTVHQHQGKIILEPDRPEAEAMR
ncbi:hypothetical protein EJB05_38867, partial [Eragrostis curvula]